MHAPGVYDAVTALLAARAGFTAMHLSGAIVSATRLGVPDLGYVTGADIAEVAGVVTRAAPDACLVADADTGYGNALHVQRTVEAYARAGAAALHLEDQVFPKRCGHMAGKAVVPLAEAAGKVRAAVEAAAGSGLVVIARTDALSVDGLPAAIERVKAYADAGADLVFVEGAADEATLEAVRVGLPRLPRVRAEPLRGRPADARHPRRRAGLVRRAARHPPGGRDAGRAARRRARSTPRSPPRAARCRSSGPAGTT